MNKYFTILQIVNLLIISLACKRVKDTNFKDENEKEVAIFEKTIVSTLVDTIATPENKLTIENHTLVKKSRGGAVLKIKYPEIKSEPALPTILIINNKIHQERDKWINHFLEVIGNDKRADTLVVFEIEAFIWANELLSVRYYFTEYITNPNKGYLNLSYSHYSLSKGKELNTVDIFNSTMLDRWRSWFRENGEVNQENSTWEDTTFFSGFGLTWQDVFENILQKGYYVIEENGDMYYLIVYQGNDSSEGTVPYQEIKDCFKIRPQP